MKKLVEILFVSLVFVIPAAADLVTISGDGYVQLNVNGANLIGVFGYVYPDGSGHISFEDNFLRGSWTFAPEAMHFTLPPGSIVNGVALTFSDVRAYSWPIDSTVYSVTAGASLNRVGAFAEDISGQPCNSTDFAGPFSASQTVSLGMPCGSSPDFLLFPTFSGNASVRGTLLGFPAYELPPPTPWDPCPACDPQPEEFEIYGGLLLSVGYSATVDYTPVPEPNLMFPLRIAAVLLVLAAVWVRRRRPRDVNPGRAPH